jgi:hypothetical protein
LLDVYNNTFKLMSFIHLCESSKNVIDVCDSWIVTVFLLLPG